MWQPVPEAAPLPARDKLLRATRYVLLNPCRPWSPAKSQLAGDPLAWPWSTLRDTLGAVVEPWIDAPRLARALGWRGPDFPAAFHRYVSSDPTVHVAGTPVPRTAPPSDIPCDPLDRIAAAAAAALRQPRSALHRRGPTRTTFLGLAQRQGWRRPNVLAAICSAHRNTAWRLMHCAPAPWIAAAALCLGDDRLLTPTPWPLTPTPWPR